MEESTGVKVKEEGSYLPDIGSMPRFSLGISQGEQERKKRKDVWSGNVTTTVKKCDKRRIRIKSKIGKVYAIFRQAKLDTENFKKLEQKLNLCGFGGLLEICNWRAVNTTFVKWIVDNWEVSNGPQIRLSKSKVLKIMEDDVYRVYHLPRGDKEIDLLECTTDAIENLRSELGIEGPFSRTVHYNVLEDRLQNMRGTSAWAKCAILYSIYCLLCPINSNNVDLRYAGVLEELKDVNNYNWCRHVLEHTTKGISESNKLNPTADFHFLLINCLERMGKKGHLLPEQYTGPSLRGWDESAEMIYLSQLDELIGLSKGVVVGITKERKSEEPQSKIPFDQDTCPIEKMLQVDEMVATEDAVDIHEYGTVVDKGRVKCTYCGKVISGFSRLRYHLAGIRKDVIPCPEVSPNIRKSFKNEIEKIVGTMNKVGLTNGHSDPPRKRHCSPCKITSNTMAQTSTGAIKKCRKVDISSERSQTESTSCPGSGDVPQVAPCGLGSSSLKELQKSILRFLCETRLDIGTVNSHSFRKMIDCTLRHGQLQCEAPNFQGLKQCLLKDSLEEMKQYVKKIRSSWASSGCSILLDGWTDSKGRDLVNVLVDCPSGAIYLRSVDLSSLVGNANSIEGLLEDILEDVGLENVVQIIADSTPTCIQEVGKKLMKKHRTWYWTVCTSRCLEIMLDKFVTLTPLFRDTLKKAKTISRFIYRNADGLKLVGDHACLNNLVHPSMIRSIMTFYTLESILLKEMNLQSFFTSSDWSTSNLASTEDGRRVSGLVLEEDFWMSVDFMIKAAIPLVRVLEIFNSENTPQLGRVYEIMDQAKEAIKKAFKGNKSEYQPFWNIIDEIWDTYLYTPLHSTGYFLNPRLFYCEDFHLDPEVTAGLLHCVTRMGGSNSSLDLVVDQTDEYRMGKGNFGPGSASKDLSKLSPEKWWLKYGDHCPELQQLAIRILSQTCNGGSKYNLKKTLAEMIFEQGINSVEKQRLSEQAFICYNMQLQDFAPNVGNYVPSGELDPKNDWIMEEPVLSVPTPENREVPGDGFLPDVAISSRIQ